jgi:hypothetical protein
MQQYFCNQCQRWMDSNYAGSDIHMRSHLTGNQQNQNSNSQNAAGSIIAVLLMTGLFKLIKYLLIKFRTK